MNKPIFYAKAAIETMMRKYRAEELPPKGHFHYHQGVFLSGVYQIYEQCGDERYFQYLKDWVDSCMDDEGKLREFDPGQLDDLQPGILLFPLFERTGEAKYKELLDTLLGILKDFPKNAEGGFWHKDFYPNQMWLDGLYMAGPLSVLYGTKFEKPEFVELAVKQALLMQEKTLDEKTGLLYHACDCSKEAEWADPETGCSPEFWGRSIGWVPVALLEELDWIPKVHPDREKLVEMVQNLLTALCRYQSEDGRWYQVVNKGGQEGNWLENSCSCLYAAAIAKAVRTGILPENYLEHAKRGYEGVIRSLEWEGENLLVGNVCIGTGVGDYAFYCARPVSVNDLHGVGAFLILCAEMGKGGLMDEDL
ncbi:MAG: glycoside hydrolase family 88 protein [Eubacteriales bacterium]|nr:glycoside hydrolase family 88 protein [Eubacteriales bacterium]